MKTDKIKEYFVAKKEKIMQKSNSWFIINGILLFIIVMGICTSIFMLTVNRSLWVDEAAFAYSFLQRNLLNLTIGAFELDQIAPIIYLYIVKFITIILGNSEATLRLFSVISYVLMLILVYKFSKNVFKIKYPLMPVAFIANVDIILRYSNEFKTYMFDAVVCLFVLYMYYLYTQQKIDFKKLIIISVIAVWASNPACFCIGGILLCELIFAISDKNYNKIKNIAIGICCVLVSFGIYYFYWLKDVSVSSNMQEFWEGYNFPILPINSEDINRLFYLLNSLMFQLGTFNVIIGVFVIISLIIGIIKKDKNKIAVLFTIFITLLASSMKMFPLTTRLMLFIYPIVTLLAFDVLNYLFSKEKIKNLIVVVIGFTLVFSNPGIIYYLNKENIYLINEEANFLIEYLDENIKEDEKIYVYSISMPVFQYKVGYGSTTFGKYNNEVKYGKSNWLKEESGLQPEEIVNEEKMYILISHYKHVTDKDFEYLTKHGYLELIINPYNTPLFYYVKDAKNMKSRVSYEIGDTQIKDGKYIVTLYITNIGETILNHFYDNIVIASKQNEKIRKPLTQLIEQNVKGKAEIEIDFNGKDEIELQLYNEGYYWFDELGIEPIKIQKNMFKE